MSATAARPTAPPLRTAMAALSANLVGIGLARFAYTPLIPALIGARWFLPSAAVYLGAANLAGYLGGALGARWAATRCGVTASLRGGMAVTAASLFACAFPLGFWWFFVWRFVSGATGGMLMALAAPAVMAVIPPERRGIAGGVIFTGVGLGIAVSGTLVPLLIPWGLVETWLGLAIAAALLTLSAWRSWPTAPLPTPAAEKQPQQPRTVWLLAALYLEYALNAVGLVPHMVFFVDFIARGLKEGLAAGSLFWIVFGAGAVAGPLVGGHVGDRVGFRAALRAAFAVEAAFVALPLLSASGGALLASSFVVGAFVPGIVAITIGRTRELTGGDAAAQTTAWAYCTTAFAVGQAIAAYGFSYLFAHNGGDAYPLFALGAAALLAALVVDIAAGARALRRAALG